MMLAKTEIRPNIPRDGRHCDLCGCSQPAVRCDKCGCQIFCLSCDDMYHRHPKRRFHLRKAVNPTPAIPQARPVLPMKVAHLATSPGDPSKMPLPPPRKKKTGKSFFDTFRRRSPSSDNSPPLPKKEYSWTDRFGNIKKFMSNRPLPPLPNTNGTEENDFQENKPISKHDLSFIHKKVDERPPQLPQRSLKPAEFRGKENSPNGMPGQAIEDMRNGHSQLARNGGFSPNENNQWDTRTMDNHHIDTLNRQMQPEFMHHGGGFPGNLANSMHQSASATDLQKLAGHPGQGMPPQQYPPYPMNPHMPPHYPYPMYPPQFSNYPQYFGNSFANLASQPTTTDGDFSDHSEASSRHPSSRRYPFRKRAKRSQSVMMDRMAYPGQFFPFGPFPPGYGPGPWAPPFAVDAPPSPASSVRSLNRVGRSRRRKKLTSEDDDEEFSMSSSPLSRPKSSSSERPPVVQKMSQPPPQTTSSEESEAENERERCRSRNDKNTRKFSDPKRMPSPLPPSPHTSKKIQKQKKRETLKHSEVENVRASPVATDNRNFGGPGSDSGSRRKEAEEVQNSQHKVNRKSSREFNSEDQSNAEPGSSVFIPACSWQCKHCTFINQAGSRICQVCCKTATAEGTTLMTSRPNSASSRMQSPSSEGSCSPEKKTEEEDDVSAKRDKQDMAVLNSALDEAEKEISRGLEELMKLKDDFSQESSSAQSNTQTKEKVSPQPDNSKPVYRSTGKMRTSILDKLTLPANKQSSKTTSSTSTETQTYQTVNELNSKADRVLEARRPSTSSASDAYNSPTAQSPEFERLDSANKHAAAINKSNARKEMSCQTQTDDLLDYLERKKMEEESYFSRPSNGYGYRYGDRMETVTSPIPPMFDRGYGMTQRSHSRASLFTGRLNDFGPLEYGLGPTPMYRSVSRSSLTGDYPESRFSEFQNLRKPDYYLSMEELVERRRQESIRVQGLELVRMIREAEQQGFTADDIQVALNNCGKQNPLEWLQENWKIMVENVINLSASYANDKKENDVGTISEIEAREALRMHKGNTWAAVTECVESRQRKFLELKARGKFGSKEITDALTSSQGDVEMSYAKLTRSVSKPFLMRIWGAGEGAQNQDGAIPNTIESFRDFPNDYLKREEDVQSEELWDEEEEDVEWDEDMYEQDDEEQGDLDLQTCREDLFIGNGVKTPESEGSDYCEAFASNTLERNASLPISETFDFPPDTKEVKKSAGFLSKLVAFRKEDKSTKQAQTNNNENPDLSNAIQKSSVEESSLSMDQQKTYSPLNMIKNTISAIRDSVGGSTKSEKKFPCSSPERRTIIVSGQIPQESVNYDQYVSAPPVTPVKDFKIIEETIDVENKNAVSKQENDIVEKNKNLEVQNYLENIAYNPEENKINYVNKSSNSTEDNIANEIILVNENSTSSVKNSTDEINKATNMKPLAKVTTIEETKEFANTGAIPKKARDRIEGTQKILVKNDLEKNLQVKPKLIEEIKSSNQVVQPDILEEQSKSNNSAHSTQKIAPILPKESSVREEKIEVDLLKTETSSDYTEFKNEKLKKKDNESENLNHKVSDSQEYSLKPILEDEKTHIIAEKVDSRVDYMNNTQNAITDKFSEHVPVSASVKMKSTDLIIKSEKDETSQKDVHDYVHDNKAKNEIKQDVVSEKGSGSVTNMDKEKVETNSSEGDILGKDVKTESSSETQIDLTENKQTVECLKRNILEKTDTDSSTPEKHSVDFSNTSESSVTSRNEIVKNSHVRDALQNDNENEFDLQKLETESMPADKFKVVKKRKKKLGQRKDQTSNNKSQNPEKCDAENKIDLDISSKRNFKDEEKEMQATNNSIHNNKLESPQAKTTDIKKATYESDTSTLNLKHKEIISDNTQIQKIKHQISPLISEYPYDSSSGTGDKMISSPSGTKEIVIHDKLNGDTLEAGNQEPDEQKNIFLNCEPTSQNIEVKKAALDSNKHFTQETEIEYVGNEFAKSNDQTDTVQLTSNDNRAMDAEVEDRISLNQEEDETTEVSVTIASNVEDSQEEKATPSAIVGNNSSFSLEKNLDEIENPIKYTTPTVNEHLTVANAEKTPNSIPAENNISTDRTLAEIAKTTIYDTNKTQTSKAILSLPVDHNSLIHQGPSGITQQIEPESVSADKVALSSDVELNSVTENVANHQIIDKPVLSESSEIPEQNTDAKTFRNLSNIMTDAPSSALGNYHVAIISNNSTSKTVENSSTVITSGENSSSETETSLSSAEKLLNNDISSISVESSHFTSVVSDDKHNVTETVPASSISSVEETSPSTSKSNSKHSRVTFKDSNDDSIVPSKLVNSAIPSTDEASSSKNDSDQESGSPSDSRRNSVTPLSPVDALRSRFEGLIDDNSPPGFGPIRPQSPFRRMSFRSTKAAIALERTRDSSTEKPWFVPKPAPEPKKPLPKRSLKQQMEIERRVRKMVADRKCRTYRKAEIVIQLVDMNFEEDESIQAANECSTLEQAISFLQQECLLCTGHFPVSHIISMVHCPHKACRECIRAYFTVQIRDRNIMELMCPFCNEPDIFDEDIAQDYFNHLDIMLKKLVDPEIHELFQRKLRDRVLMRDPNFKWCSQCSSGFIAMPNLKRLVCPDCNAVTCATCRRPWERDHEGISCEAFAAMKDSSDAESQAVGLAKMLTEDGIDCPRCHFRYALAKGGCMHFRCIQCQHDFCSGCTRPFKMGQKCGVSEFCAKLGLHAHHPRNCLFYLRDKDPEDLQRLLQMNDVQFDIDPPEEVGDRGSCQVLEQKETSEGMVDDYCGKEIENGMAGLCRVHYVEYLGQLVNKNQVDPIQIFGNDDLELVLRRANIRLPPKRYRETDDSYREKLVNLIQEDLPLDKMDGS